LAESIAVCVQNAVRGAGSYIQLAPLDAAAGRSNLVNETITSAAELSKGGASK